MRDRDVLQNNPDVDRAVLIWLLCIPVRVAIASIALWTLLRDPPPPVWVRYTVAGYVGWTALGFWTQAIVVRPTVGGFGGVVWWSGVRWVHAVLWTVAAILLATSDEWWAAVPLFVDVAVGVARTVQHQTTTCTGTPMTKNYSIT